MLVYMPNGNYPVKREKKNPETGEKRDDCKKWASELWLGASTLRADVALDRAGI